MQMDPVVALMEELRAQERVMDEACAKNAVRYSKPRAEDVNAMLARVKALYGEIMETQPTSPLGASILIRMAVGRMPFAYLRYTSHLQCIADRLEAGQRLHTDLVWLRALGDALRAAEKGVSIHLGLLIARAVRGVARPVVVYRAVLPPVQPPPNWQELALGPR